MAGIRPFYLTAADAEGMVYRFGYHKPDGRPGVVSANQGRLERRDGWESFQCDLFGCRRFKVQLAGRATEKARVQALGALVAEMKAAGAIFEDAADRILAKIQAA